MSHNGNYTPTLDVIASHYCNDRSADNYEERMAYEAKRRVEFDRMIAKVRAEAKQEALREAAGALDGGLAVPGIPQNLYTFRTWLRARADKLVTG